jgi:CheY-like chemotaxis protein
MGTNTVHLLLVEDDDVDAESMIRSLRRLKIANPIVHARDGIEALAYLRGEDNLEKLPSPFLIVLDINMPRMNGIEFLEELRKDDKLKSSLVFVLTTSDAERDIVHAYNYNIAGYLLKSRAGSDFSDVIKLLDHYWKFVEFPVLAEDAGVQRSL